MSALACFASSSRVYAAVAILAGALSAGCAQNRPADSYDSPSASSFTDAQYQAEGSTYRPVLHAPSQLRINLKPTPTAQQPEQDPSARRITDQIEDNAPAPANNVAVTAPAVPSPGARAAAQLMPQPQTYMGTLPCFSPGLQCAAQRVTLTLAPNGRWRSRTFDVEDNSPNKPPLLEQGCWVVSGERPPRVLLLDAQNNARAEFVMAVNNVLRVKSIADNVPNLGYNLTRQPDLDPIDELSKQPAPKCP
jgi:hypothetical protein